MVPERWGHTHTTNDSLAWLRERFKDRLISRKCEIEWAVHSPDLNPPYFYLWGYFKDNVYENNPQTIGELKAAITAKIREISKEECVKYTSVPSTPRMPFGAHFGKNITILCKLTQMAKTL